MMELANGKDDIPYMKWKLKKMFETTNQLTIAQWKSFMVVFPYCSFDKKHVNKHIYLIITME